MVAGWMRLFDKPQPDDNSEVGGRVRSHQRINKLMMHLQLRQSEIESKTNTGPKLLGSENKQGFKLNT
jgi:hypothetical protein